MNPTLVVAVTAPGDGGATAEHHIAAAILIKVEAEGAGGRGRLLLLQNILQRVLEQEVVGGGGAAAGLLCWRDVEPALLGGDCHLNGGINIRDPFNGDPVGKPGSVSYFYFDADPENENC